MDKERGFKETQRGKRVTKNKQLHNISEGIRRFYFPPRYRKIPQGRLPYGIYVLERGKP